MTNYYTEERAEYVRNNRDKFAHYGARQRDKLKLEMVSAYGGRCVRCGMDNPFALCLDHINDDSEIEWEYFGPLGGRGGDKLYHKLKNEGWPKERFQLMCYNCNAIKEHERRRAAIVDRWGPEEYAKRDLVQARIGLKRSNKSGIKGVFWNTQKSRWEARISVGYKVRHLGFFHDDPEGFMNAALAYMEAARAAWGSEANLQSIEEIRQAIENQYAQQPPLENPIDPAELGL